MPVRLKSRNRSYQKMQLLGLLLSAASLFMLPTVALSQPVDFVRFYRDSTFSIEVPDYLIKVNDLNSSASLQFSNYLNETYLMVVEESLPLSNDNQLLDSLAYLFKMKLKQKNATLVADSSFRIEGYPARQHEISLSVEGTPLQYLVTFIIAHQRLFKIYSWTLLSQRNQYFKDFQKAARSFDFLAVQGKRKQHRSPFLRLFKLILVL